jgi:hypothetical protein
MDLTDRQRKLLFAGLVVVLAAAGVFLTFGGGGGHKSAAHTSTPTPTPTATQARSSAPPLTAPSPSGSYDIYSMLPFTKQDFTAAADVARRFTIAYGTYRFDEDPKAYASRLSGMVTSDLGARLEQDASAPSVIQQRQKDQEVSTSDARMDSLRDIAKDQLIFLVTGTQHITKGGKTTDTSQQYAVTTTRSGGSWVVYAFAPADEGDN